MSRTAAECIKLANASFDEPMEARYRLFANDTLSLLNAKRRLRGKSKVLLDKGRVTKLPKKRPQTGPLVQSHYRPQ